MNEETIPTAKKYYDNVSVGKRTQQESYFVQQHDKERILLSLLKDANPKQILILVKSKKSADKLFESLKKEDYKALAVHGNHRASQAQEAALAFNNKELSILITTNAILSTLTLSDVTLLINYDLPLEPSDYFKGLLLVDEVGVSIALVDPEDEKSLASIEMMMKCEMTEKELEGFEHTSLAQKQKKDKTKKPRHKKVLQRAKRKAEIKSKWIPVEPVEE